MSDKLLTPQAVTAELDISPATLRRWADSFADYLSAGASPAPGSGSHRRYTPEDQEVLELVKELLAEGLTYEEVNQQLAQQIVVTTDPIRPDENHNEKDHPDFAIEVEADEEDMALIAADEAESPAVAFLTNTLSTLSDTQKSILNSQSANRELLGVLIQDNFNLKEENNRLRERVLEIERTLAQNRREMEQTLVQSQREGEWRYEALRRELEAKVSAVQQTAHQAMTAAETQPEIKTIENKPGCLGALFGGGGTQVVSVPRRKSQQTQTRQQPASGSPPAASHPRPDAPPE